MGFETVVVIGGNGWLGSYIISLLVKIMKTTSSSISNNSSDISSSFISENMTVHSVDIRSPRKEFQCLHEGETMNHICDISNKEMITDLINYLNPSVIFHVASVIDLRVGPTPLMDAVNVDGTTYILEALLNLSQERIRYLVYTSSIDVVATQHGIADATEDTPTVRLNPSNGYKRTKSIAEHMVLSVHSPTLRCCSLRPGHIFGPGDPVIQSSTSPALGPSSARMAFTYVENTAYAHILAAYRLMQERQLVIQHLERFPVTAPESISLSPRSEFPRYLSLPYLTQTPLFIYDYNVNFCDMYHSFANRSPSPGRIPIIVLATVITIVEFLETILIKIFQRHILQPHPFLSITSSILEACGPLSINTTRAHKLLPALTGSCSNFPTSPSVFERIHKLVDKDEAITRTQYWLKTGKILMQD